MKIEAAAVVRELFVYGLATGMEAVVSAQFVELEAGGFILFEASF